MKDRLKSIIVCRCEEITEEEIREAISIYDIKVIDDVKRLSRAGMGLCQGKVCSRLVEKILAEVTGTKPGEVSILSKRPPTRPIKLESFTTLSESQD